MPARIATAAETLACERATIDAGTPSAELMRRAGHAAADVIASKYESTARGGVAIYAGPGNNGGDGWVVAESLAQRGFPVVVIEHGTPKTDEAASARASATLHGVQLENHPGKAA